MTNDIDVVILWVDGNDPEWRKEKSKYSETVTSDSQIDGAVYRYRDWDNLQYIFRGIEQFAPWVRKVHFVTYGHLPKWLNTKNPKLNIVKHEDYIPQQYLPTFSSHPIELNLHRIKGLAEKFVYFNDDMFILKPIKPTLFFRNGLPCDQAHIGSIISEDNSDIFPHILLNDIATINKHFCKSSVMKTNPGKWFSPRYSLVTLARNIIALSYGLFPSIECRHMPSPFLRTTFEHVWQKETKLLEDTSSHKFRHIQDVNQYLMKEWQIVTGKFSPKNIDHLSMAFMDPFAKKAELNAVIREQKIPLICINEPPRNCTGFDELKSDIKTSFEEILPSKSSFEQ